MRLPRRLLRMNPQSPAEAVGFFTSLILVFIVPLILNLVALAIREDR